MQAVIPEDIQEYVFLNKIGTDIVCAWDPIHAAKIGEYKVIDKAQRDWHKKEQTRKARERRTRTTQEQMQKAAIPNLHAMQEQKVEIPQMPATFRTINGPSATDPSAPVPGATPYAETPTHVPINQGAAPVDVEGMKKVDLVKELVTQFDYSPSPQALKPELAEMVESFRNTGKPPAI